MDLASKRVLIADDHEVVRTMVCSLFESEGFDVYTAADGGEAVDKATVVNPDLVVLDLQMPVLNGIDAAKRIKMLKPELPLLLFTNHGSSVVERDAKLVGITGVVSKSDSIQLIAFATSLLTKQN